MKSGLYTTDSSDFYLLISIKYQNEDYVKSKISLCYKKGLYEDHCIERKNYKLYKSKIKHWKVHNREK